MNRFLYRFGLVLAMLSCGSPNPDDRAERPLVEGDARTTLPAPGELEIIAAPAEEMMRVSTRLELNVSIPDVRASGEYWFTFTKPAGIVKLAHAVSGEPFRYEFFDIPGTPASAGVSLMRILIPTDVDSVILEAEYVYSQETLAGFVPNPATGDNLQLGQLRTDSIFVSHLNYYPSSLHESTRLSTIRIVAPAGWTGLTSGTLARATTQDGKSAFEYRVTSSSGRLPYPLAIFPYSEVRDGAVSVFFAEPDRTFAEERLRLATQTVLPFLTNLLGPPPFEHLKIVEVFPFEGNTGLAARDVVLLSQAVWFASPIGGDATSTGGLVLVDEIAHQWNFYKVLLPNYLAEGVSEYVDALFIEHVAGRDDLTAHMDSYRQQYTATAQRLNELKALKEAGLSASEAASQLQVPLEEVASLWEYANLGEAAISNPRVLPLLYFVKGALALHALRAKLGDEAFFAGFKSNFAVETTGNAEVSLDAFRGHFEEASGVDLREFFSLWYEQTGLPATGR